MLADEADRLIATIPATPPTPPGLHHDPTDLRAALLLLAGLVDDAVALLDRSGTLGWSRNHPGPVVVPYLLVAASDALSSTDFASTRLRGLLAGADTAGWLHVAWHDDELSWDSGQPEVEPAPEDRFRAIASDELALSHLLVDQIRRQPPDPVEQKRWLEIARRTIDERVADIVGNQHRGAYARAAQLVAACAEALTLAAGDDGQAAAAHVAAAHEAWPRHSAFRRELDVAARSSPVIPAAAARR